MNSNVKCILCSSSKTETIQKNGIDFIYCNNCDFLFIKNYPSANELISKFEQDYIMAPREYLRAEHRRSFRLFAQLELLSEIYQYKHPPAKILDYGCGRGYFIDEARRHGYITYGVEISRSAIYYCKNIGLNVVNNIEDINDTFDIILMYNSLLKSPDPILTLKSIRNKMSDDSYLIIKVPYSKTKSWKLFQTSDFQFFNQQYLQHFSPKSLKLLLEISGFQTIKIDLKKSKKKYHRRMLYLSTQIFRTFFNLDMPLIERIKRMLVITFRKEISAIAKKK
jgi:SAM-dependent methyltransferase